MSLSLVLLPLAIASISAWKAGHEDVDVQGRTICRVRTRMKDQGLLMAALRETQADVSADDNRISAQWKGVEAEFFRSGQGVWQANFTDGVDIERASSIIEAIDVAYGRQVQQAVLAKLRARAPAAGMSVGSETIEADSSVTLILNVEAR